MLYWSLCECRHICLDGGCSSNLFSESPVSREECWTYRCVLLYPVLFMASSNWTQVIGLAQQALSPPEPSPPLHLDFFFSCKAFRAGFAVSQHHRELRDGWEDHHVTCCLLLACLYFPDLQEMRLLPSGCSLRIEWIHAHGSTLKDGSYFYTLVWALITMWSKFPSFTELKGYITWSLRPHFWILWSILSILSLFKLK